MARSPTPAAASEHGAGGAGTGRIRLESPVGLLVDLEPDDRPEALGVRARSAFVTQAALRRQPHRQRGAATTTGNVIRNRRTITLTAKERSVLEALPRASPAGLSAEKLLEQAWDENADPFTNTVRVTIGRLRRKLGEPEVIETTPRIG